MTEGIQLFIQRISEVPWKSIRLPLW